MKALQTIVLIKYTSKKRIFFIEQIDKLIYELYSLIDEEEIKIVEESV